MKIVGRFNNLSKKFLEERGVKTLKPKERKRFRYAHHRLDPSDKTGKTVLYPTSFKLPPTDQVYDPYAEYDEKTNTYTGAMVDIGPVHTVDRFDNPERVIRRFITPDKTTGEFWLYGDKEEDRYLYWYMQITNYNSKNKFRTTDKEELFYEVDETGEATKAIQRKSLQLEVDNYVHRLAGKDLVMIGKALGWDGVESKPEEVLKKEVWDFASNNPEAFVMLTKNEKKIETLSIIKQAMESGILVFDETQMTVTNTVSNEVVATLKRIEGKGVHEQLDDYFKTTTKGEKQYETIKKLVAAKAV